MATLTNEFQKVIETSTKVTQNVTGYLRLYLKYGNRNIPEMKDTIYYEIRQQAVNPYGNYFAWQWDSALAWSIKEGNNVLASGTYTQSAIYSDGKEKVRASGSFDVTHNADGTWEKTLTLNGYVYNISLSKDGLVTLPRIIVAPSIKINGIGSISSNRAILDDNGANISVTLSDTNNELTTIEYSTNNTNWNYLLNTYGDDTLNLTLPNNLLNAFPTNRIPTIYLRAGNSKGNSTSIVCYLEITLQPDVPTILLSPENNIKVLDDNNIFLKNFTKFKIFIEAIPSRGATIKQYDLINYFDFSLPFNVSNISNPYIHPTPLNIIGNYRATLRIADSRTNSTIRSSNEIIVIDYYNPTFSNVSIERCNENGDSDTNGTYAKLNVDYKISSINNINTKKLEYSFNESEWYNLNITNYSGTKTSIIGGTLAPEQSYTIYLRLTDLTTYTTQNIILPPGDVTISKRAGGKGVTFGRIAEEDGFNVYMDADFKKEIKKNGNDIQGTNILFNYGAGFQGDIDLNDDLSNYDYIEIIFKNDVGIYNSTKIAYPNGTNFSIITTNISDTYLWLSSAIYYSTGNKLELKSYKITRISENAIDYSNNTNNLYITRVIGYK